MSDFDRIRSMGASEYLERRKKSDWIVKMATILSLISWAFAIAVWAVLEAASPERNYEFITSFFSSRLDAQIQIRSYWDTTLLPIAFLLLVASFAICLAGFIFNKMRMRRKTDKYRKSIIIIGIITILGIAVFLVRFGWPF